MGIGIGLAWRLSVYRHGSHTGIHTLAFNEVPFRIGIHTLAMKEIQLAIAMALRSHTGIPTLAFNEVPMGIGMVEHWHLKRFHWALGWPGDWHLKGTPAFERNTGI